MRPSAVSTSALKAASRRSSKGNDRTYWRTGTSGRTRSATDAAVFAIDAGGKGPQAWPRGSAHRRSCAPWRPRNSTRLSGAGHLRTTGAEPPRSSGGERPTRVGVRRDTRVSGQRSEEHCKFPRKIGIRTLEDFTSRRFSHVNSQPSFFHRGVQSDSTRKGVASAVVGILISTVIERCPSADERSRQRLDHRCQLNLGECRPSDKVTF